MNYVLIFCNSTASRLIYARSHYNMCAGGGYMYQIKPLANGNVVFPKQKDIKKQPMFTCLQTKEYCY